MAETDQARPLSPRSNEEKALETMEGRRKIKQCVCVTAMFLLLIIIVIIILAFTVFKIKDPKITTNKILLTNLDLNIIQIPTPQVKLNMSLLIDMSIKNPNIASFKFDNSTTSVYYRGILVADAQIPSGLAKARKTLQLNVPVVIMANRLASSPDLLKDVLEGKMIMNTYSILSGIAKIWFIKKDVVVDMNCTMTINISDRAIQDINCQHKVIL